MKVRYIGETFLADDMQTYTIVKDGIYEAYDINHKYNLLSLVGVSGGCEIDLFQTLDGNPVTYINDVQDFEHVCIWNHAELREDDLFICISTKLKTLTYGKIYTLDNDYLDDEWYLRFKETKTKRKYGRHNFRRISKSYLRTIKINDVLEQDSGLTERFKHDDVPLIEFDDKIDILLEQLKMARQYIKYTGVKNISILDLIRSANHHLIEEKDLESFSELNLKELLNNKN